MGFWGEPYEIIKVEETEVEGRMVKVYTVTTYVPHYEGKSFPSAAEKIWIMSNSKPDKTVTLHVEHSMNDEPKAQARRVSEPGGLFDDPGTVGAGYILPGSEVVEGSWEHVRLLEALLKAMILTGHVPLKEASVRPTVEVSQDFLDDIGNLPPLSSMIRFDAEAKCWSIRLR